MPNTIVPGTAYQWINSSSNGNPTAVIVEQVTGNYAKVVDLNTLAKFGNIETKNLRPYKFPHPLSLYAGRDTKKTTELVRFLKAHYGDQLDTSQHPADEAQRLLSSTMSIIISMLQDQENTSWFCGARMSIRDWLLNHKINIDKYKLIDPVADWVKKVPRLEPLPGKGNEEELKQIAGAIQKISSKDIALDVADKLRELAQRILNRLDKEDGEA